MIQLHPDQAKLDAGITEAQQRGARNVLAVAPTGSGKSVLMAHRAANHNGASIKVAHRQELVSQISLALGRFGVRHRIIGPHALIRNCVAIHMSELGLNFYDPLGRVGVAGVDTLVRRLETVAGVLVPKPDNDPWFQQITLWQTDEAHHLLADNKWGKATLLFPNAVGIGWTATPGRADGKGLGRHADGLMDAMVMGPTMRELIELGRLADYRIFAPTTEDLDLSGVTVTASGDFSPDKLRQAVHQSRIVGDVVAHYQRIAPGKLGITFAVDVEDATKIALAFRAAGVPAEVVTSETPDVARAAILRRFRKREVLQLVNVDLFGEGFDVPACEVVSFARPTASFTLYVQQFGRACRTSDGKDYGILIDHVGNVLRHGLPDRTRNWTLDRRESRRRSTGDGVVPIRACPNCTMAYERHRKACPFCHHVPEPIGRSSPDQVDGDLQELDPAVLRLMREEVERVDGPSHHAGGIIGKAIDKNHLARQQAQATLRNVMWHWCGWRRLVGEDDSEMQKRFFFQFGTDLMTAQTLGATRAAELEGMIAAALSAAGVIIQPVRVPVPV